MMLRQLLLGLGGLALMAGIGLSVLWIRTPTGPVTEGPTVVRDAVLVASRALPLSSILRADDLQWASMPIGDIPPGAFRRDQTRENELFGAATRRGFQSGEVLVADQIIKPTDSGFLPAVLGPGMRATSLAVDPAEGGAGLIAPGDHVDVILIQSFNDPEITTSHRSVGETVLRNLRVIAVDQAVNATGKPKADDARFGVLSEPRLPRLITLEVTARQVEALMVARQLGTLQLALMSLADTVGPRPLVGPPPTWAEEVSPALKSLEPRPSRVRPAPAGADRPLVMEIIHGVKSEQLCFSRATGAIIDCAEAVQPAGQATPAEPVAPGVGAPKKPPAQEPPS